MYTTQYNFSSAFIWQQLPLRVLHSDHPLIRMKPVTSLITQQFTYYTLQHCRIKLYYFRPTIFDTNPASFFDKSCYWLIVYPCWKVLTSYILVSGWTETSIYEKISAYLQLINLMFDLATTEVNFLGIYFILVDSLPLITRFFTIFYTITEHLTGMHF